MVYRILEDYAMSLEENSNLDNDHEKNGIILLKDCKVSSKVNRSLGDPNTITISWSYKDKKDKKDSKEVEVASVTLDEEPASDGYVSFGNLKINDNFLGYGLGTQIIEYIKSKYKAGAVSVGKDCKKAISVYKKCGFVEGDLDKRNNRYLTMFYEPNKVKQKELYELVFTPRFNKAFGLLKEKKDTAKLDKIYEAFKVLRERGFLGGRNDSDIARVTGNHKLKPSKKVNKIGKGKRVWDAHIDDDLILYYTVDTKAKKVYLRELEDHDRMQTSKQNSSLLCPYFNNRLFEEGYYEDEGFVSINMRDALEWQERQERKRLRRGYEYDF